MCITVQHKIPTGCRAIDEILQGGIPSESVSLIYGEAETAKTTMAMQCTANCAKEGTKTLFIDCDGTFSAKRLSQIASGKFEEIADLIIFMRPKDFREQSIIIDRLPSLLGQKFGLLVVDTVTSLYRARVAESPKKAFELNRELNRQLASLAQIARTRRIAVLMVSQVRTAFKEDHVSIEPVATRVLKFWADTIMNLKPTENSRVIKAILEKLLTKVQPTTCYLRIEESGLRDYLIH
jgi:DNA repair protein RadB